MDLGAFSVSLAVKDIQVSYDFYSKLGFTKFGGDAAQGWLILQNGTTTIGLFQNMFEKNMLTFNPGWNADASDKDKFDDIRLIQQHLKDHSIPLMSEADATTSGPASIMLEDPDGNPILIDQHR